MTQKNLLIALITLIVAIFVFAQVYIIFTVTTINDRINDVDQRLTRFENRVDKRFAELDTRFDERFTELETRLDNRIDGLRSEMNQRLSDMNAEIRDVRSEVRQLNQNYSNHLAHHTGEGGKP